MFKSVIFSILLAGSLNSVMGAITFSNAKNMSLVCKSDNFDPDQTMRAGETGIRFELKIKETGPNTFVLGADYGFLDRVLVSVASKDGIFNIAYDQNIFINDIIFFKLTGDKEPETYRSELDWLYEIHSMDENVEIYRETDLDIVEIVPNKQGSARFEMILHGEQFEPYDGSYAVNCFVAADK